MKKSLLLHALSLNDRILEPNHLPLNGYVWAYDKDACSREMFVGNCITILSLMGMEGAQISWSNDIMAFDVQREGIPYTVIISLQDDSLASDFYYFLGIWACPEGDAFNAPRLDQLIDWEDEDILKPDVSYHAMLTNRPLQYPEITSLVGGTVFSQGAYNDQYRLYGTVMPGERQTGTFLFCPVNHTSAHAQFRISHLLYSIRNLVALTAKAAAIHQTCFMERGGDIYDEIERIRSQLRSGELSAAQLALLVAETADAAFAATEHAEALAGDLQTVQATEQLFSSITGEMELTENRGFPSLSERIRTPIGIAEKLLKERLRQAGRLERRAGIIQQQLHSFIAVQHQLLLQTSLSTNKTGENK